MRNVLLSIGLLLLIALAGCNHSKVVDGSLSEINSISLHGDTLTIMPVESNGLAPYPFGFGNTLADYQHAFSFLPMEKYTNYQGNKDYYIFKNSDNRIVLEQYDDNLFPVIYADIKDKRIMVEPKLHVGQKLNDVLRVLNVKDCPAEVKVVEVGYMYEKTSFFFDNGYLQRILVQSDNQSMFNPLPLGFQEAGCLRGWKGEKLFAEKGAEFMEPVAFLNEKGDTIVQKGRYSYIGYDSIAPIGLVAESHHGIVALNTHGEKLFEVMQIDNLQPDIVSDGRFRIIGDNGLTGYADTLGNIVVQPQYQCAMPFDGGRAKVAIHGWRSGENDEHWMWMSDEWFYIDTNGHRLPDVAEQDKR